MLKKSIIWITIGGKAYQEGIQDWAVAPVCVVLDDVQAETDGGGDCQGQLGGGAGDAPGLGHGHDVTPRVECKLANNWIEDSSAQLIFSF